MGGIISYIMWGGDPDVDNPESGLSKRDIYYVQRSWKKVTADDVGSGTELLIRFFETFPENRMFFRTFKDMPPEELRTNIQFNAHALNIISTLTTVVDNLDKPKLAATICKKIGTSHNARKIGQKQFNELKDVLVKLFVEVLKFNNGTMKSWVKAATFMYDNIFTEIKQ